MLLLLSRGKTPKVVALAVHEAGKCDARDTQQGKRGKYEQEVTS